MDLEKLIKDKKIRTDKKPKDDSVLKNSQFAFGEITKGLKKSTKQYDEPETLEMPFSQGISEPENDSELQSIAVERSRQQSIAVDDSRSQSIAVDYSKPQSTTVDNSRVQSTAVDDSGQGFPLNPTRFQFLMLDGYAKKILEVLIEHGADKKPVIVTSDELRLKTNIKANHLSDIVFRMKKKGYLKCESAYGKRIFEVNPSILK